MSIVTEQTDRQKSVIAIAAVTTCIILIGLKWQHVDRDVFKNVICILPDKHFQTKHVESTIHVEGSTCRSQICLGIC